MPRPIRAPTKSLGGGATLKSLNNIKKAAPPSRKQTKESVLSKDGTQKPTTSTIRSTRNTRITRSADVSSENIIASEQNTQILQKKKSDSNFSVTIDVNQNANRLNQQRRSSALRRADAKKGDVSPRKSSPLKTSPVKTRRISLESTQESTQLSIVKESQESVIPETPKRRKVTENEWVDSSPLNSSQQENRSPSPRSSPPPLDAPLGVSTPLQTAGRTLMRFRSDEGFTPPPPSRRLPLQEVRRRDRSPIRIPDTPSRTSTQRSRNIWSETDDGTPPSGQPEHSPSPFFPRHFPSAGFEIFEDGTATQTPPRKRGTKRTSTGGEKPPSPSHAAEPNPTSTSHVGSEGSDGDDTVIAPPATAPTKRTRAAAAATKKAAVMPTAALQALMPRRKESTKKKTVKRVIIDSEGNSQEIFSQADEDDEEGDIFDLDVDSDEDELNARKTVRKAKAAVAPKKGRKAAATKTTKAKPATKRAPAAKKSTTKDFIPVFPRHKQSSSRTYSKKSTEVEPEREGTADVDGIEDNENQVPDMTQRTKMVEEVVQKAKEHFKEVDAWELEFETVSGTD